MGCLVKIALLVTFIISTTWKSSEGYTLDYKSYVQNGNRILTRFRRQTAGQSCNGSDQFECANGQCIEIDGKCDGITNCEDKSDEPEELCLNIFCPTYTYKCKYGVCVDIDAECNGIKDCNHNSDEDEKKCGPKVPVFVEPVASGKKCLTPAQPHHGQWTYLNDGSKGDSNTLGDANTAIILTCDHGYKLSSTTEETQLILCGQYANWSITVMPTCQKLCRSLYNNPLITLSCKTDGSIVPCNKATDNTILTYKCAPYYEGPHGKPERNICFDGSWDYTPECVPVCGQKRDTAIPLIVNGYEVKRGNYPWMTALYSNKESTPDYTNICGGTLITTGIVLTAAQCVTEKDDFKIYNVKYFRVGAGKYYNRYNDENDKDTAQYVDVAEIITNPEYRGEIQNFHGDIALLRLKTEFALSKVVQPVCINNLPSIVPKDIGVVTGWGYTTETGQPSETLKEVELPYIDDAQCFNELDPDFAKKYFTSDKLCAGYYNQNINVCKGDSGGGLVFRNPENRFFVHGIVSSGHCCTENQEVHCNIQGTALFTKVETYIEWIQVIVGRWTSNKMAIR